jgi:hypothetical protein
MSQELEDRFHNYGKRVRNRSNANIFANEYEETQSEINK